MQVYLRYSIPGTTTPDTVSLLVGVANNLHETFSLIAESTEICETMREEAEGFSVRLVPAPDDGFTVMTDDDMVYDPFTGCLSVAV